MQDHNLFGIYLNILNKNQIQYFVTGSVASIVYGEPRLTHDIDLVIFLLENEVQKFVNAFPIEKFYCPPDEIIRTELKREVRGHFNLIHHETGFKADIYFAGKEVLHLWALKNIQQIDFSCININVAPPEYVILKKLIFYKEGKAQKHLTDIQGMLTNSKDIINFSLLNDMISKMGLEDVWHTLDKD
ncbi:MAG: hypothetical protein DRQ01_05085 [Ignavibacteriae bacterium]|nr:MAG: hypothetical protein DRQ01_05085 [Ignavibacteriota bacterium]